MLEGGGNYPFVRRGLRIKKKGPNHYENMTLKITPKTSRVTLKTKDVSNAHIFPVSFSGIISY